MSVAVASPGGDLPPDVDAAWLARVGEAALAALGRSGADLAVLVCDDAFIRSLNADWRGKDQPTDVLSFPQHEFPDGPNVLPSGRLVLGDVVVSVETAARQAASEGHSLRDELAVLLVHGICHVLGWDHEDPSDAGAMRAVEARVLREAGAAVPGLIERADPSRVS